MELLDAHALGAMVDMPHMQAQPRSSGHNHDVPPPGCDPDAIKLFVGGIPKCYTEGQLLPFFSTIGKVVDLIVVRKTTTHQSKGSAFLWYEARAAAEQAIHHFHMRQSLPDPTGMCHRPLVVTRARDFCPQKPATFLRQNTFTSAPLPQGSARMAPTQMPVDWNLRHQMASLYTPGMGQGLSGLQNSLADLLHANSRQSMQQGGHNGSSAAGLSGSAAAALSSTLASLPSNPYMQPAPFTHSGALDSVLVQPVKAKLAGNAPTPAGVSSSPPVSLVSDRLVSGDVSALTDAASRLSMSSEPDSKGRSGPHEVTLDDHATSGGNVTAAVDIAPSTLPVVNDHMHSVQSLSGAQLSLVSNAPGHFSMNLVGTSAQVVMAQCLLDIVVSQGGVPSSPIVPAAAAPPRSRINLP